MRRLASNVKAIKQNAKPNKHKILDEPLIDLAEPSQPHHRPKIISNAASNHPSLIPSRTITHTHSLSNVVGEDVKPLQATSTGSPRSKPFVQQVARVSPDVESPLLKTPVSVSGSSGIDDGISPRVDPFSTNRLRHRWEQAAHKGHYDRSGKTIASYGEGVPDNVEYCDTNPGINRQNEASTKKAANNAENSLRNKNRNMHRQSGPAAEGSRSAILTTVALKYHEIGYPSIKNHHDTDRPRRRVKDNSQDVGHHISPLSSPLSYRAAWKSSILREPRLLKSVDNTVRNPIMPELETVNQEQQLQSSKMRVGSKRMSGNAHEFMAEVSKPASIPNSSKNTRLFPS